MTASTDTVTLTVPTSLAWQLKSACVDSATVWHRLWQDAAEGRRTDLDRDACAALRRDAWVLWECLHDQGV